MNRERLVIDYLRRWRVAQADGLATQVEQGGCPMSEQTRLALSAETEKMPVSPALHENRALIESLLGSPADFTPRPLQIGTERRQALLLVFDNLSNRTQVMTTLDALVVDLRSLSLPEGGSALAKVLTEQGVVNAVAQPLFQISQVLESLLGGNAVLLVEGFSQGIVLATSGWESRRPEQPVAEPVVRGPKEGFTETLGVNLALVRRRIRDDRLRVDAFTLGTRTKTAVRLLYMAGIALPALVGEVHARLNRIKIDGILESGYIEELIEDNPWSPFPQVKETERPDVVAAELLEGRVVLLTDGTPHALILPATFFSEMQASEDYYQRWMMASAVRFLRYLFLLFALLGPAAYIAVTTYHHEMIPTSLLLSLIAAREGVPYPAILEALAMELTLEALREAGIRLPQAVGQAISIVGALVLGEAAVRAGLVSPVMVIVVSTTAIASFIMPHYSMGMAVRLLRFAMMFLAATLGFVGITVGLFLLAVHLASLRSFGVPYLSPVMPPTGADLEDVVVRAPRWWMRWRPRSMPIRDAERGSKTNQPEPPGPAQKKGDGV